MLKGPPGVGKTWVGLLLAHSLEDCLIISFRSQITAIVISAGKWQFFEFDNCSIFRLSAGTLLAAHPEAYVIVDGLDEKLGWELIKYLTGVKRKGIGVLYTTTSHVDIKYDEVASSITTLFLPSWTWADLKAAVMTDEFATAIWSLIRELEHWAPNDGQPSNKQLCSYIKRKFEICGGNARRLFGVSLEKCRALISSALSGLSNSAARKDLLFADVSAMSQQITHRLMQLVPCVANCKVYCETAVVWLVGSKFILSQLRKSLLSSDLQTLVDKLPGINNQSVRGWVFEVLFLHVFLPQVTMFRSSCMLALMLHGISENSQLLLAPCTRSLSVLTCDFETHLHRGADVSHKANSGSLGRSLGC
eukprot:TRINITY_DN4587_c0_g1_i2.p1 TRINITY_DN4587_c0_g1~~TRINITY_DN4587_c0_g1_i2.p1  ORF type:complete len:362 (+),score=44.14 TRINITY_DN4587_c0_g1_i2:752-1837(+)